MKNALQEIQSIGIHDVVNAQGLQCIVGRFRTRSAICRFSHAGESFTAKEEDGLASFLILNDLEAKIFQFNFLEGHNVRENDRYSSSTQRFM